MSSQHGEVLVVAVVTGGAQGIGKGICVALLKEGINVVFGDINEAKATTFQTEWNSQRSNLEGELTFYQPWDARSSNHCKNLIDFTVKKYNKVNILVNNVGVQPLASAVPAHQLDEAVWDWIHQVNLKSYFLMAKYVLPHFIANKSGVIINIASIQAIQSQPSVAAYASTKGAILSLTRALAMDYGRFNIRVNCISPGTIASELSAMNTNYSYAINNTPLGRVGINQDVANLVLFLSSEKSNWITGQNFVVDGGITIKGGWADLHSKM